MARVAWVGDSTRERWAWLVTFTAAAVWPLLLPGIPPLQDLPNHLARVFVLLNGDDPLLSQHFVIAWKLLPNLAWDAFGVVVGKALSLEWTAKAFILLSMAMTISGVFLLSRALTGKWTWAPLLAVPFLFNAGYSKGFLSFNFGVGLAMLACAWWASQPEARWRRRLAVAFAFSLLLYYAHLVVWGAYGAFVLALKLHDLARERKDDLRGWMWRLLRDGTQAAPPLVINALAVAVTGGSAYQLTGEITSFENPLQRFLGQFWHVIDGGAIFPAVFALAAMGLLTVWLVLSRQVRFQPAGLAAIGVALLLFLALPDRIYGTWYVAWRLALFAILFAAAAALPRRTVCAWSSRLAPGVALIATLGMSAWQAHLKRNADFGHQQFSQIIARIPSGSTLFAAHAGLEVEEVEYDQLGLYHFGSFAVTERQIMVQSLFSNPTQQPIYYRQPQFQNTEFNGSVFLGNLTNDMGKLGIDIVPYLRQFDWIVTHGPAGSKSADVIPFDTFRMTEEVGDFRLYCKLQARTDGAPLCLDGQPP